jgi:REP element-mobilizing transposase RayT
MIPYCEDVKSLTLKLENHKWERAPVDILSMCLMPNHFHLQVKQLVKNGISTFMHRLGTSYTNYFNTRHERTGCLFQGTFKSVRVENEGQFLCLNRIHVNPIAGGLVTAEYLGEYQNPTER